MGAVFGSLLLPPCAHRGMKDYKRKDTISSKHWELRMCIVSCVFGFIHAGSPGLCPLLWYHRCRSPSFVSCVLFCWVLCKWSTWTHEAKLLVLNIVSIKHVSSLLHWMNHDFFTFMWTCTARSPNVRFMWTFKKGNTLHKITLDGGKTLNLCKLAKNNPI